MNTMEKIFQIRSRLKILANKLHHTTRRLASVLFWDSDVKLLQHHQVRCF